MTTAVRPRKRGEARDEILEWLGRQPAGFEFHYTEIADDLGISRPTVAGSLIRMARASRPPAVSSPRGRGWWRLPDGAPADPAGPAPGDLLEVVGELKDGSVLLRDSGLKIWKAEAM